MADRKILIVEDDRKIALALGTRLRSAGYEVTLAYDTLMGVAAATKVRPDLIILDIGIPAGGGLTLAERVNSLLPSPVQLIVMTASKRAGLEEQARALGAVAFVEKPYDSAALLHEVRRALGEPVEDVTA